MAELIKKYQDLLTSLLEEFAETYNRSAQGPAVEVLCDYQRNHFQLLRMGWYKEEYRFGVLFHFDIRNGKIWIQENRTDRSMSEELVRRGVPKTDIVIGHLNEADRALSEFAVA